MLGPHYILFHNNYVIFTIMVLRINKCNIIKNITRVDRNKMQFMYQYFSHDIHQTV